MATVAVLPPFPTLFDNAGKPLDAGFVYVGEENQDPVANPIAIFWDAAMTIPAPNPFRTTAGFYSRSGSPGNIFAADNYSMRVCDKGNTQLYVIPSSARVGLGDIVLSSGESLVAEAGSTIDVKDGASVKIGSNDGVGVVVEIADNARISGDLVPSAPQQSLGTEDGFWDANLDAVRIDGFLTPGPNSIGILPVGTTAQPMGNVVTKRVQSDDITSYRKAQVSSNTDYAGLASLNARTNIIALAKQTGTNPAVLQASEAWNVSGITTSGGNQPYIVTFIAPISPNAFPVVTNNGPSQSVAPKVVIAGDGLTATVTLYSSADAVISGAFTLVIFGAPSATGVAGIVSPIS